MDNVISESLSGQRFDLILISTFASVALLLAALGTYAVLAYNTKQRTREIGVRIALGATKGNILRLVVGQGLRFAVFGVALGLGGAFGLTRFLASLLYQVKPYDLATFAAVSFVLLFVSFVASYLPARRATRELDSGLRPGFALWPAHVAQISQLHGGRYPDSRPWHRCEHGGLFRGEWRFDSPAGLPGAEPALPHTSCLVSDVQVLPADPS